MNLSKLSLYLKYLIYECNFFLIAALTLTTKNYKISYHEEMEWWLMRQIVPIKLYDKLTKLTRFEKKHFQKDSY